MGNSNEKKRKAKLAAKLKRINHKNQMLIQMFQQISMMDQISRFQRMSDLKSTKNFSGKNKNLSSSQFIIGLDKSQIFDINYEDNLLVHTPGLLSNLNLVISEILPKCKTIIRLNSKIKTNLEKLIQIIYCYQTKIIFKRILRS